METKKLYQLLNETYDTIQGNPQALTEALQFAARIRQDSIRNSLLLQAQDSRSRYADTPQGWHTRGYSVNKTAKALRILSPVERTFYQDGTTRDGEPKWRSIRRATQAIRDRIAAGEIPTRKAIYFIPRIVYDITQTNCPPDAYSAIARDTLTPEMYTPIFNGVRQWAQECGFPVLFEDTEQGYYDTGRHSIVLNRKIPDEKNLNVLLREIGTAVVDASKAQNDRVHTQTTEENTFEASALGVMLQSSVGLQPDSESIKRLNNAYAACLEQKTFSLRNLLHRLHERYIALAAQIRPRIDRIMDTVRVRLPERDLAESRQEATQERQTEEVITAEHAQEENEKRQQRVETATTVAATAGAAALAAAIALSPEEMRTHTLQGRNFSGVDLSNADFSGWQIKNCRFDGCNLTRSKFDHATILNSSFLSANLADASIQDASLMENDMRFAIFDRADLQNTYWKSNQVDCTSIDQTNFDFGVLRNNIFNLSTGAAKGLNTLTCVPADISAQEAFEHATHPDEVLLQQRAYAQNLLDTMAAEGNTSDAYKVLEPKLRELTQPANTNQNIPPAVDAFLRQLTTSGTMDEAVRAQAAVLLKSLAKPAASIPQEQPASTGRGSLKLTQVEVKNKTLYGRDFSGQNLSDIDFSGWHLENCNFDNATIQNADFSHASIINSSFVAADLRNANLRHTQLRNVDLTLSTLIHANFGDAALDNSVLTAASVDATQFNGARAANTKFNLIEGAAQGVENVRFLARNAQDPAENKLYRETEVRSFTRAAENSAEVQAERQAWARKMITNVTNGTYESPASYDAMAPALQELAQPTDINLTPATAAAETTSSVSAPASTPQNPQNTTPDALSDNLGPDLTHLEDSPATVSEQTSSTPEHSDPLAGMVRQMNGCYELPSVEKARELLDANIPVRFIAFGDDNVHPGSRALVAVSMADGRLAPQKTWLSPTPEQLEPMLAETARTAAANGEIVCLVSQSDLPSLSDLVRKHARNAETNQKPVQKPQSTMVESIPSQTQSVSSQATATSTPPPASERTVTLPPAADGKFSQLFGYLTTRHGISYDVAQSCVEKQQLYQDKRFNAVFVQRDSNGEPVWAIKLPTGRGTSKAYTVAGSKNIGWCYENPSNVLYVANTPLDALSIVTMEQKKGADINQASYLALNSKSNLSALYNYLQKHPQIDTVVLAMDNNEQGQKLQGEAIQELGKQNPNLQLFTYVYDAQGSTPNEMLKNKLGISGQNPTTQTVSVNKQAPPSHGPATVPEAVSL